MKKIQKVSWGFLPGDDVWHVYIYMSGGMMHESYSDKQKAIDAAIHYLTLAKAE